MTDASTNPFAGIGFEPDSTAADDHEITVHPSPSSAMSKPQPMQSAPGSGGTTSQGPSGANPFAAIGFDDDPQTSSATSAPDHPGLLANAPGNNDSFTSGTLKNVGTTAIKGLAHAPGFVGDLDNFADTLMEAPEWVESKITGQPFADVVKKRKANAAAAQADQDQFEKGLLGFSVDPRHYLPSGSDISNFIGNYTGMYKPTTTLGKYGSAAGEAVLGAFGPGGGNMIRSTIEHALPNAAAGVGAQYVGDRTGDPFLASMAGVGASGVSAAMKNAPRRQAARILSDAADDPNAAMAAISRGDQNQIPGVDPMTAELTRDPGLYRLQNEVLDQNPDALMARRVAQNRGRLAALDNLMPDGNPQDVARFFSQHFDDIGNRTQALVEQHLSSARVAADALRGRGLPTDAYGTLLRNQLTDAESARSDAEDKLWKAVDRDGTLTNDMSGIKQAGASIYGQMPAADQAFMSPAESAFHGLIGGYNDVEPFRQVASLKSNLATAMRKELSENGRTPAYRRMSLLMNPVQETINGTVARRAAADNAAVAAGQMAPENAFGSVLARLSSEYAAQQRTAGTGIEARAVGDAARAPAGVSDDARSRSQEGRQSLAASGNQGLQRGVPRDPSQVGPAAGAVTPSYYPGGVLGVRHELAEHGDLITSHDADFRPRSDFPQNLQPRARDSAGARDQVIGMASRLQPDRLGPSAEANSGAPIVGPDNVVESGNGRTMAIGKAYDAGRGDAYRQHLEGIGFDTSGYEKPVLIGRRVTPMSPDEREFFTHAANGATALRMGSAEQAAADAKHITPAMLDGQAGPNIASAANRLFVGAFMSKLPAAERGALVDQGGNLSQTGVRRIQAAMAANAYSDNGLLSKAFDDADPNVKGLIGALVDASGPWAKMRSAASRGDISPEHDVTPELMGAVKLAMRARDEGRPLGEVLRQGDLFNSDTSRLVSSMLSKDGEKLASRPQIEAALRSYAEEATKNASGDRLFGEPASVGDVLKASQARADRETGSAPAAPVFSDVPPAPKATMDEAAAERIAAANKATKDKHEIFGAKPIADVLAESGGRGNFKTPASAVPSKLFPKGPGGFEAVTAFRRAVNDDGASMRLLRDHAVDSMRRDVMADDGTLPEAKLEKWRDSHEDALRAFPELAEKFKDAGAAATTYHRTAADRRDLIRQYERSAFGSLMNASHPDQVNAIVASLMKNPRDLPALSKLTQAASKDPAALAGLRRAVVENIVDKHVSDIETASGPQRNIKAKAFQDTVRKSRAALDITLGSEPADMLSRIANTLPNATASLESAGQAKLADLTRYLKAAQRPHETLGERLFKVGFVARELGEGVGELFGSEHGGGVGTALAGGGIIGKKLISAIRATGARKVGDLLVDATLNPERYRDLAALAPLRPDTGSEQGFAYRLRRASMFAPDAMSGIMQHAMTRSARLNDRAEDQRRQAQARAAGGRVTDAPVAHIKGDEIAPHDATTTELRKAARDYYERTLRGTKVFSQALGRHVEFHGARKAFSASGNPDKLRMFAALKDIVGKGTHVSTDAPQNQDIERSTRAYHYLEAHVGTPSGNRKVGLTVREDTTGHLYYNHSMRDEEERPRPAATEDTAGKAGPGSAGSGAANPNIDLDDGPIKRAAGGRVEPTDAQKEAGNYKKDHMRLAGMDISIENRKGKHRTGIGKNGKRWAVQMPADYGYIRGTTGADGDHVDCYVGPHESASHAYIIDQNDADTGKFDEHKVMLGFPTERDALQTYADGFSDGRGPDRIGAVTKVPTSDVLAWAKSDAAMKPSADHRAKGGRIGGGGPFGVPTYGQVLAPAKKAIGRGFGFADGGRVDPADAILARLLPKDPVERALRIARG